MTPKRPSPKGRAPASTPPVPRSKSPSPVTTPLSAEASPDARNAKGTATPRSNSASPVGTPRSAASSLSSKRLLDSSGFGLCSSNEFPQRAKIVPAGGRGGASPRGRRARKTITPLPAPPPAASPDDDEPLEVRYERIGRPTFMDELFDDELFTDSPMGLLDDGSEGDEHSASTEGGLGELVEGDALFSPDGAMEEL